MKDRVTAKFGISIEFNGYSLKIFTAAEWKKLRSQFEQLLGWSEYDSNLISLHIANCGYGIIDQKWQCPVDDDCPLYDMYDYIKKNF